MEKIPPPAGLTVARVVLSVLGGILIIFMGDFSLIALGFSTACADGGDSSDCGRWITIALFPGGIAVLCSIVAITVAFRAKETRHAWVVGLSSLAVGTLVPLLSFSLDGSLTTTVR